MRHISYIIPSNTLIMENTLHHEKLHKLFQLTRAKQSNYLAYQIDPKNVINYFVSIKILTIEYYKSLMRNTFGIHKLL